MTTFHVAMQQSRNPPTGRSPRTWVWLIVAGLLASATSTVLAFGFDDVAREADRLARAPYRMPPPAGPRLTDLSYHDYR